MLMPVAVNAEAPEPTGASSSADHQMANAEEDVNMIGETAKPDPPDDPIIEDPEEEESEKEAMDVAREDEPTVECISEIDKVERVAPGPTQDHPRSTPVMLEPARQRGRS